MSLNTFASLGVPEDLVSALGRRGITAPFPIQAATVPDAIAGHDICGRAPTGSGKTLAFGIALALRTGRSEPGRPQGLVLVPTRELAAQVQKEIEPLTTARGLRVATVYGGVGYEDQRRALRRGVDILVACPGRLEDLVASRTAILDKVGVVVIDEADRMADMGFLPAVKRILDASRAERQTLLFSATLDGDVDVLIKRYQRDPRRHAVEHIEEEQGDVHHVFWKAERQDRVHLTAQLVAAHAPAIVFCRTRHGADRLAKQLSRSGVEAAAIHGSRTQPQRDRALRSFSQGRVQALVATDVAARGIHVDAVSCVVHYDPPTTHKDYVHRSGRTGRAGADGTVVSLVGREQAADVRAIQRALRLPEGIDIPNLGTMRTGVMVRPQMPTAAPQADHGPRSGHQGGSRNNRRRRPARRSS